MLKERRVLRFSILAIPLAILLILTIGSCRRGVPVLDRGPKPVEAQGTISGRVRSEGTASMEGRVVEAINVETGERQRVTTISTGGFTFKLQPGKYRLELHLLEGETIVKQPGVIDLNRSDVDSQIDIVVKSARLVRPRSPVSRPDTALGMPIA